MQFQSTKIIKCNLFLNQKAINKTKLFICIVLVSNELREIYPIKKLLPRKIKLCTKLSIVYILAGVREYFTSD